MVMFRMRLLILSSVILALISSCVTNPGQALLESDPPIRWEQYGPNLATLARVSSRTIPDLSSRVYALIRSAEAAYELEVYSLAMSSLSRAQFLIQRVQSPILQAELYSALARTYLAIDEPGDALLILTRAVDLVIQDLKLLEAPDIRSIQVLEDIIYNLFALGPEGFDQLRRAVQRVYLIPDYGQRVLLLTQIAAQYQTLGVGQRANLLLQQAIAALDAITIPELRVRGYAAVARRFFSQQDFPEANYYASRAFTQLNNLNLSTTSTAQLDNLVQALTYLIEMDFTAEATNLLFLLPSASAQQSLLSSLARQYFATGQPFAAELILQQLVQQVSAFFGTTTYVYGILRVVEQYREAEDELSAEFFLERLVQAIINPTDPFPLDDVAYSEVLGSALRLGRLDLANSILSRMEDPYLSLIALDRVVTFLQNSGQELLLEWTIEQIELQVSLFEQPIDDGQARLALIYTRQGKGLQALQALDSIQNPYILSLTASEMAFFLPPEVQDGLIDDIENYILKYQPPPQNRWLFFNR